MSKTLAACVVITYIIGGIVIFGVARKHSLSLNAQIAWVALALIWATSSLGFSRRK
jgi:hypothetical protein